MRDDDVQALIVKLRSADRWQDREHAADALRRLVVPEAVDALLKAARDDPSVYVRHAAVRALGRIGGPSAVDGLVALWHVYRRDDSVRGRDDGSIHFSVDEALATIGRPAVPAVRRALVDPDWRVRAHAVQTLAMMVDKGVVSEAERTAWVSPLRSDAHHMVRWFVQQALGGEHK